MPFCRPLLLVLVLASFSVSAAEPGFTSLFDGKTLEGWIGAVDHAGFG